MGGNVREKRIFFDMHFAVFTKIGFIKAISIHYATIVSLVRGGGFMLNDF